MLPMSQPPILMRACFDFTNVVDGMPDFGTLGGGVPEAFGFEAGPAAGSALSCLFLVGSELLPRFEL